MNKKRIIFVCLCIGLIVLTALVGLKIKNKEDYRRKIVLAGEIHKVLDHLMFDLYGAGANSIQDVPADGEWHHRIAFAHPGQGRGEYQLQGGHLWRKSEGQASLIADHIGQLLIRRQKETPDILEVQIEAKDGVSLLSHLKIRIRH